MNTDDRNTKTMEECARESRDSLAEDVRLAMLLSNASRYHDIEPDEWLAIEEWLDVPVQCSNCDEPPSDHCESNDNGWECAAVMGEEEQTEFEIDDLDELREAAEERLDSQNYGADISFTVDVTLYGGGPAGGIEFECGRTQYGLEMYSARQWHQDWFQSKGWVPVDDEVASYLWERWGLENLMEGQ